MTFLKKMGLAVSLIIALSIGSFAQTATTTTTISAAITSTTAQALTVASASGFSASTQTQEYDIFVDGELMKVQTVSGTTITVSRAIRGTRATAHPSGSVVFFGLAGGLAPFSNQDQIPGTACTATQYAYLPIVNYANGNIAHCRNSRWVRQNLMNPVPGGVYPIADSAVTVSLADYIIEYTSLTAARTITLPTPSAGIVGKVYIIKNGSGYGTNTLYVTPSVKSVGANVDGATIVGATATTYPAGRFYTDGTSWFSW